MTELNYSGSQSGHTGPLWHTNDQLQFGGALVTDKLVTSKQLELAIRHSSVTETTISNALIYIGAITQKQLLSFLEHYDATFSRVSTPLAGLSYSQSTTDPMNEDDRRFLRDWDDHIGSTLRENYDLLKGLDRVPVCTACPMAQWYKLESAPPKPGAEQKLPTLECFCTAFRGVMYGAGRQAVTACDARADALKKDDGDLEI